MAPVHATVHSKFFQYLTIKHSDINLNTEIGSDLKNIVRFVISDTELYIYVQESEKK